MFQLLKPVQQPLNGQEGKETLPIGDGLWAVHIFSLWGQKLT